MALTLLPVEREEAEGLRRFLAYSFGMREDAPFLERRLIEWKWFQARPDWSGPRSYVLKHNDRVVAHGCSHPVTFATCTGDVASARVIDWAADPKVPGVGVLLFRKFGKLAPTLLAVGGSAETQDILPKIGFRRVGEMSLYALPVRPLRQFLQRSGRGWREAARLARNAAWARARLSPIPAGLSAERVRIFASAPLPAPAAEFTPARRSPELLNYMLACPGAAFCGFLIREDGLARGYFVLSRVGGQTRIADIWTEGDWRAAFSLAAREAARDPETSEVTAVASLDHLRRAIEANGFRGRGAEPIFLNDPEGLLANAPPLLVQLLDGDECYLNNPDYQFLS